MGSVEYDTGVHHAERAPSMWDDEDFQYERSKEREERTMTGYLVVRHSDSDNFLAVSNIFTNPDHAQIMLQAKRIEYPSSKYSIATVALPSEAILTGSAPLVEMRA